MTQTRRQTVEALFQEAADLTPDERRVFLDQIESSNAALHAEVQSLLGLLEKPKVASLAAVDEADSAEFVGDLIGPYRIVELIGEGGFGAVYLAEQEQPIRRRVALKIIKLGMDTKQVIARFEAERQALALMDHPNIARVLDAGATEQGRPYFVMELVRGVPITDHCDAHDLSVSDRLDLFTAVCHAVQHAHQKGVIHRDIKPSNVLVARHDGAAVPKVIDFGIAKATDQRLSEETLFTEFHQFVGTPEYMSPEQAQSGVDLDTRTDIYSLGALLYVLLTGKTPFDRAAMQRVGLAEIQRIVREETPPTPSQQLHRLGEELQTIARARGVAPPALSRTVRGDLDWIVMKALEKDRGRRYDTAAAFAADVRRFLNREPVEAGPPSTWYRVVKFVRRNRITVGVSGLIALALLSGLGLALMGLGEARRAKDELALERDAAQEARASAERERERAEENATAAETAHKHEAEARARAERSREAAVKEATRARKVSQFLQGMITKAFPVAQGGKREVTVRTVLMEAIRRLDAGAFEEQPVEEMMVRGTIAGGFATIGEYAFAEKQVRRALSVALENIGPRSVEAISSRNLLSAILHKRGHYTEAAAEARQAILDGTETLGTDHPEILFSVSHLAAALATEGKLREAEKLYRKVLRRQVVKLGEDNRLTLFSMHGLAVILYRQGRCVESERLHRRVLEVRRRTDGPDGLETCNSLLSLCPVLLRLGRVSEAVDLGREALAAKRSRLGSKHPDTAIAIHNVALGLRAKGEIDQAIELLHEALAIQREGLGLGHQHTHRTLQNLILMLVAVDRLSEAEDLMETWDEAFRSAIEPGDAIPETYRLYAVFLMTISREDLRDPVKALAMARQAHARGGDVFAILVVLANALRANGHLEQACRVLERALDAKMSPGEIQLLLDSTQSDFLRWSTELRGTTGLLVGSARLVLQLRR